MAGHRAVVSTAGRPPMACAMPCALQLPSGQAALDVAGMRRDLLIPQGSTTVAVVPPESFGDTVLSNIFIAGLGIAGASTGLFLATSYPENSDEWTAGVAVAVPCAALLIVGLATLPGNIGRMRGSMRIDSAGGGARLMGFGVSPVQSGAAGAALLRF